MTLFALPTELRLTIYSFLLPPNPLSSPRTAYTGILYSCRELRAEFEPELLKRVASFLKDIQSRCRAVFGPGDAQYVEPRCVSDMYDLKFTRPLPSYTRDPNRFFPRLPLPALFARHDPFMAILYLHLRSLTITAVPPTNSMRVKPRISLRRTASNLVKWLNRVYDAQRRSGVGVITFEWPVELQLGGSWEELRRFAVGWDVGFRECGDGEGKWDGFVGDDESRVVALELRQRVPRTAVPPT